MMTPGEMRGRVMGIYLLNRGLLAGALAAWLGARDAVLIMGLSCFLLVLAIRIFVPRIWYLNTDFSKTPTSEVQTPKV